MSAPPATAPACTIGRAAVLAAIAIVGGVALWPDGADAAARVDAAAPAAPAPFAAELAAEVEDLARGALAAMDAAARGDAIVGRDADANVMLARAVPPAAIASGGGLAWSRADAVARGVLDRLLERSATALLGGRADPELARLRARDALAFAWAGGARGTAFYVRVHGAHFVLEWVRTGDGALHGSWRDFVRDRAAPWLRETVFPARR